MRVLFIPLLCLERRVSGGRKHLCRPHLPSPPRAFPARSVFTGTGRLTV